MSWIILAFGSVAFFTSLNLFQRLLATKSKDPRAMALLFNTTATLIAFSLFLITDSYKNFTLPSAPAAWITLLIASFCYGIFERGRFVAAKFLDASVLTTIVNVSVLIAFVGSLILYSEPISIGKLLGASLIIVSLFLVTSVKQTSSASKKGVIVAIAISTMLGIGWMLDKQGAQFFNASTYNLLIWAIPIIYIYLPHIKLKDINSELKLGSWKLFALAGLNVIGYFMQLKALESAEATKVIPIVQTSTLFTILLGIVLLKERQNIARKIVAGTMALAGVYLLL